MNTGLTGAAIFVRPEDQADFEALKSELALSLDPTGAHERFLFDLVLSAAWDIRRCLDLQAAVHLEAHSLGLPDPFFDDALAKKLDRVLRYKRQHETSYRKALGELKKLAAARQQTPRDVESPAIEAPAPKPSPTLDEPPIYCAQHIPAPESARDA